MPQKRKKWQRNKAIKVSVGVSGIVSGFAFGPSAKNGAKLVNPHLQAPAQASSVIINGSLNTQVYYDILKNWNPSIAKSNPFKMAATVMMGLICVVPQFTLNIENEDGSFVPRNQIVINIAVTAALIPVFMRGSWKLLDKVGALIKGELDVKKPTKVDLLLILPVLMATCDLITTILQTYNGLDAILTEEMDERASKAISITIAVINALATLGFIIDGLSAIREILHAPKCPPLPSLMTIAVASFSGFSLYDAGIRNLSFLGGDGSKGVAWLAAGGSAFLYNTPPAARLANSIWDGASSFFCPKGSGEEDRQPLLPAEAEAEADADVDVEAEADVDAEEQNSPRP